VRPKPKRRTKAQREAERTLTAYHEAGHLLAAWRWRGSTAAPERPRLLTIVPTPGRSWGHMRQATYALAARDRRARELGHALGFRRGMALLEVRVHLAGVAAEEVLTGARRFAPDDELAECEGDLLVWLECASCWTRDYASAQEALWIAYPRASDATSTRALTREFLATKAFLAAHWPAVRAVAAALLEHGTLGPDELEALAEAHPLNWRRWEHPAHRRWMRGLRAARLAA